MFGPGRSGTSYIIDSSRHGRKQTLPFSFNLQSTFIIPRSTWPPPLTSSSKLEQSSSRTRVTLKVRLGPSRSPPPTKLAPNSHRCLQTPGKLIVIGAIEFWSGLIQSPGCDDESVVVACCSEQTRLRPPDRRCNHVRQTKGWHHPRTGRCGHRPSGESYSAIIRRGFLLTCGRSSSNLAKRS